MNSEMSALPRIYPSERSHSTSITLLLPDEVKRLNRSKSQPIDLRSSLSLINAESSDPDSLTSTTLSRSEQTIKQKKVKDLTAEPRSKTERNTRATEPLPRLKQAESESEDHIEDLDTLLENDNQNVLIVFDRKRRLTLLPATAFNKKMRQFLNRHWGRMENPFLSTAILKENIQYIWIFKKMNDSKLRKVEFLEFLKTDGKILEPIIERIRHLFALVLHYQKNREKWTDLSKDVFFHLRSLSFSSSQENEINLTTFFGLIKNLKKKEAEMISKAFGDDKETSKEVLEFLEEIISGQMNPAIFSKKNMD